MRIRLPASIDLISMATTIHNRLTRTAQQVNFSKLPDFTMTSHVWLANTGPTRVRGGSD
jgi:hypothetical protein